MSSIVSSKHCYIFKFFEEISAIPRCSGEEKQISDYLADFARKRNLEFMQDRALNIIIKKPAAKGYENVPTVILQGHMDMVCEKNKGTKHDFKKDPIKIRVIDDMIYATDTTLGADNGIALAYCLALLDSKDIPHPALEVIFTTDEESTMSGALNLDTSGLKGKILINLDSEEEGRILVSSAGGTKAKLVLPVKWDSIPEKHQGFRISIGGLKGGHSGVEIDKGRGNANKLLGRLLNDLSKESRLYIADINGGLKSNAIPRESEVLLYIDAAGRQKIEEKVKQWENICKNELRASDPDVYIRFEAVEEKADKVFSGDTAEKLVSALVLIPNGIQSMSMEIKNLVESSTNLGVVYTEKEQVCLVSEIRSSVKSLKKNIYEQVAKLAEVVGGQVITESDYPEWEYKADSKIRPLCIKAYRDMFGKEPEVVAIHAGLECGVLMSKLEGLDAVSVGPDMADVHTPNEHISIPSVERTWEYLLEILKQTKSL